MKKWVPFAVVAIAVTACQDASGPAKHQPPSLRAPVFTKVNGIPDRYVVVFKDAAVTANNQGDVEQEMVGGNGGTLTHSYRHALNGFAAFLSPAAVSRLAQDPRVKYIEQDAIAHAIGTGTQRSATWGIDRIDQRALPLSGTYTWNASGVGVTAYIIDTGIKFDHTEFVGRAFTGEDEITIGGSAADCNGHGTHVSGTVGGKTYGVARDVKLVAVRVLDCSGSGAYSAVIAGVDFVTKQKNAPGAGPAVANMSLGGSPFQALDDAIDRSTKAGVVYAVAAGNDGLNACNYSPARAPSAITVGATDNSDTKASWSNIGTCVDIFAPGVNITSSWYTSTTATNIISGTSMASPHVTGAAALYLEANPSANTDPTKTVGLVTSALTSNATLNAVKSPGTGSPNRLLYTGFISAVTTPVISLSPSSFSFNGARGGTNPASQNLSITNSGAGTLNWSASTSTSTGGAWLSVSPTNGAVASGAAPSTVAVSVTTAGLAAATYTGTITVTDPAATPTTQTATVTLTVVAPPTAPTLISPVNGAAGVSTAANLSWSASGGTSYLVQVSAGTSVGPTYVYNQSVTGTSTTVSGLSPNTTYAWQVTATNTAGSATSGTSTFTTAATPPPAATANFTASCPTMTCTFTNTSTGVVTNASHVWTWGDGSTTTVYTTATQTHLYTTAGNKSVKLTVTNPGAAASSITKTVTPRNCVNGNGDC